MRFTHGSIRAHEKGTATSENEIKKYNARGGRCFTGSTGENLAKDGLPACYVDIHNKTIRITTEESYNEPPNIYATDIKNGQKRLLLKLNPQFDYLQFGKVELLEWTDEGGRAWTAGWSYLLITRPIGVFH